MRRATISSGTDPNMKLSLAAGAATACLIAIPSVAHANDDDYLQLAVGADYSTGDYGQDEDTEFLAVPVTVKWQTGDFNLRVSVPYINVSGPADLIPGEGGVRGGPGGGGPGGGGGSTATASRSGIGDTNVAATYSFEVSDTTYFDVTGKVKLPTGSQEKALSTGTTDFTLQGEVLQVFGDVSAAVRAGRRFNGQNDDYPLEDAWLAGAGLYFVSGDSTFGLDYDWRDGSLPTSPNRSEVTGSLTHKLNDGLRLQGYAYTGLADGSPDVGVGAQVMVRFGE